LRHLLTAAYGTNATYRRAHLMSVHGGEVDLMQVRDNRCC